ncbi:hypothetical protein ACE4RV_07455 [Acetobacter persici]|uniref:Uncharacterized protein n=2 Tax=Gluconacetobacter sacchari TaxID=92759 RepID=A0A7W4IH96_9PROT|nr:hypothetical protein [Gluconacetobacter sacchari]MBB2162820.1 hypothetical protein [Gluconacetobacter sacchari]
MGKKVLAVLTGKSEATIRAVGGSGDWAIRPSSVRDLEYVVCVRHANPPYDPGPGARPEQHGEAFLVGKVVDLKFSYHHNGRDRFVVMCSEMASVSGVKDFWDGSRVPTRYMDEDEARRRGIDFDELDFKPITHEEGQDDLEGEGGSSIPTSATARHEVASSVGVMPLTILAAKKGLAANFHVPIEDIEIIIRG